MVFELRNGEWDFLLEGGDEWLDRPYERPSGDPPLCLTTGITGRETSAGVPIMCFAGVVSTAGAGALVESADGSRPVSIDRETGAFVALATGQGFTFTVHDAAGRETDRVSHSRPW